MSAVVEAVSDVVGGVVEGVGEIVKDVGPILTKVAAVVPGPWQAPAIALNAVDAIAHGNPLSAALSIYGFNEVGGFDALSGAAELGSSAGDIMDEAIAQGASQAADTGTALAGLSDVGEELGTSLGTLDDFSAQQALGLDQVNALNPPTIEAPTFEFTDPNAYDWSNASQGGFNLDYEYNPLPTISGSQYLIDGEIPSNLASLTQAPAPVETAFPTLNPNDGYLPGVVPPGVDDSWSLKDLASIPGKAYDFLQEAGKTPIAQGIKTVGSGLGLLQTGQNILNSREMMDKQKQVMDAQLAAYASGQGQQPAGGLAQASQASQAGRGYMPGWAGNRQFNQYT